MSDEENDNIPNLNEALYWAIKGEGPKKAAQLPSRGADINASTVANWTPLAHAAEHLAIVKMLLERGCKKQKLRAHSDLLPNPKVNDWALSFGEHFDIQTEAKGKNLAAEQLYRQHTENQV